MSQPKYGYVRNPIVVRFCYFMLWPQGISGKILIQFVLSSPTLKSCFLFTHRANIAFSFKLRETPTKKHTKIKINYVDFSCFKE
jgi:hypothetical protein